MQGTVRETVLEEWKDILLLLGLSGVTQTLAANCTLERHEPNHCHLRLNEHHASLWNGIHESRISQALSKHYNCEMRVSIEIGETQTETPAQLDRRQQEDRQEDTQHRLAPTEAGVILDLEAFLSVLRHADDDGEGADVHQGVDHQVEEHARRRVLIGCGHGHQTSRYITAKSRTWNGRNQA